jgi:hypothetical protein
LRMLARRARHMEVPSNPSPPAKNQRPANAGLSVFGTGLGFRT